jgi:hypothetical protein
LRKFLDFLTPENAQIAIGGSFDDWDTKPFTEYTASRLLANVTSTDDKELRDMYSSPLALYWQDFNMYGDRLPIPETWKTAWTNPDWYNSACQGLYLRQFSSNTWIPESIDLVTDCPTWFESVSTDEDECKKYERQCDLKCKPTSLNGKSAYWKPNRYYDLAVVTIDVVAKLPIT